MLPNISVNQVSLWFFHIYPRSGTAVSQVWELESQKVHFLTKNSSIPDWLFIYFFSQCQFFFVVLKNPIFSVIKWPRTIGLFRQSTSIHALVLSERWRWIFSRKKLYLSSKRRNTKFMFVWFRDTEAFGSADGDTRFWPLCPTALCLPVQNNPSFLSDPTTHTLKHTYTHMAWAMLNVSLHTNKNKTHTHTQHSFS